MRILSETMWKNFVFKRLLLFLVFVVVSFRPNVSEASAENIEFVGHIGGETNAFDVSGDYIYIGEGPRLTILDASDPSQITVSGKTDLFSDIVQDVVIEGNYAYVAADSAGLRIVDVSDPTDPVEVGEVESLGTVSNVTVSGNYTYVVDNLGLRIIDTSNPNEPSESGIYELGGIKHIALKGDYIYVSQGFTTLRIVDISDPSNPSTADTYHVTDRMWDIVVEGDYVYVAADSTLQILDVTNPTTPLEIGLYDQLYRIYDIAIQGDLAYLGSSGGLRIVNINEPTNMTEAGVFDQVNIIDQVEVIENIVYLNATNHNLLVLSTAQVSAPMEVGSYIHPSFVYDVDVEKNNAYLGTNSGMNVFDVSRSEILQDVNSVDAASSIFTVIVEEDIAYVLGHEAFQIIDIADLDNLGQISSISNNNSMTGLAVQGQYAFISGFVGPRNHTQCSSGCILDLSDLVNPIEVSPFPFSDMFSQIQIAADETHFYISDIWDYSNPSAPVEVGTIGIYGSGRYVINNNLFVVENTDLYVVDVTDRTMPNVLGQLDTLTSAYHITVVGNYAYIAERNAGVSIVDVRNPLAPVKIGHYDTVGNSHNIYVVGKLIYVADGEGGLTVLRQTTGITLPSLTANYTAEVDESVGGIEVEFALNQPVSYTIAFDVETDTLGDATVVGDFEAVNARIEIPAGQITGTITIPIIDDQLDEDTETVGFRLVHAPNASDLYTFGAEQHTVQIIDNDEPPSVAFDLPEYRVEETDGTAPITVSLTTPSGRLTTVDYAIVPESAQPNSDFAPISGTLQFTVGQTIQTFDIPILDDAVKEDTETAQLQLSNPVNLVLGESSSQLIIQDDQPSGDGFEINDECISARQVDHVVQTHSLHDAGDVDWTYFAATTGAAYRITVDVPNDSPADVVVEIHDACGNAFHEQGYSFAPGVRIDFASPETRTYYLRIYNDDPTVFGDDVKYELSVREVAEEQTGGSAVIIVAGRDRFGDRLQGNIHNVTNQVYRMYQREGYADSRIFYLATDFSLNPYQRNNFVDAMPTKERLEYAITEWARNRVNGNGALTLYFMSHGFNETFYLDKENGEQLEPAQLAQWLSELEAAVPGVKINVVIDACYSGSFLSALSQPGRLIITSAADNQLAYATHYGARFSDYFLLGLQQRMSVHEAFSRATAASRVGILQQTPWLDDNGNGIPNDPEDGLIASQRGFNFAGSFSSELWEPYIKQVDPVEPAGGYATVRTRVLDDIGVESVTAIVYPPSYVPPTEGDRLEVEPFEPITLTTSGDGFYTATVPLYEVGTYTVVFSAIDGQALQARPVSTTFESTEVVPTAVGLHGQMIGQIGFRPIILALLSLIAISLTLVVALALGDVDRRT